jgi:hypothetical protein
MNENLIDLPGDSVTPEELSVPKARDFARYLATLGSEVFAELHDTRKIAVPDGEAVIFSVNVERPQKLSYDIRRKEWLAAIFWTSDNQVPEVLSLRRDFPKVPHLNLREKEFPRSLCLYDQPYDQVRLTWTPANFLDRVRFWLARTAVGTLHGDDQPLEPYISGSGAYLVVPSDFNANMQCPLLMDVFICGQNNETPTFRAIWQNPQEGRSPDHIAAAFSCLPQTHGVMRHQPPNLWELHQLCRDAGLNLVEELIKVVQEWHIQKPAPKVLETKLIIIIALPKTRSTGGPIETVETRAFLTGKTVKEIGLKLGAIQEFEGKAGHILGVKVPPPEIIEGIPVSLLQMVNALSAEHAAAFNGNPRNKVQTVAIGMGTLGSQTFNNLVRAGFGQWTLIDDDLMLPHNCARHFLGDWAVGTNKAEAMAKTANAILDGKSIVAPIPGNFLRPGNHAEAISGAISEAKIIIDFSASIAVARDLASREMNARCICAYLFPKGDGLIVAAEDRERGVRLNWLEMLHYRAVLNETALSQSLQSQDVHFRYGNSCRDVSSQLAQDDAAIWSGVASKAIKELEKQDIGVLCIYMSKADDGIEVFHPQVTKPLAISLYEWTIVLDHWLLTKLAMFRQERLPNETGGVLVGNFDTQRRICFLVDSLPSPPDSEEWPMSYIRGCEGLREKVRHIESLTLKQLGYVGEWHSHPDGCPTRPSADDYKAYSWLVGHMQTETLPGIMLIIGENLTFSLVSTEPGA